MIALNIRDFPPGLLKALKVQAVKEDKTLRQLCIEILEAAIEGKEG